MPETAARITSTKNPLVKRIRSLSDRTARDAEGRIAIEGIRLVEEALAAGVRAELLLFDPGAEREHPRLRELLARASALGVRTIEAAPHVIEAASEVETPQGVIGIFEIPGHDLARVLDAPDVLLVVVDRVQDPGNLGTIIRVADAAGASAVAVTRGSVDPHNPKSVRATMGSLFHLPVVEVDAASTAAELKRRGVRILVADQQGVLEYTNVSMRRPVALVFGSEALGADPLWREAAESMIRIPMYGRSESLNVAIAAALLLYEVRRRQEA
ncbi:MAG: TrmH family RNA methyltransferase [bacterium]